MRPPRFRFPDEVRSTTRSMASRMVREGTPAGSAEELDAWIAERPEVREPLERGGYGVDFTSDDLLPLLDVFIVQAGGAPAAADVPAMSPRNRWVVWGVVVLAAVLLVFALFACAPALPGRAAAVSVRYEHVLTCPSFMGRDGRFFAYRVVRVDNGGPSPFTLQPSLLRFPDGSGPVFTVPEFSDLTVAPGAGENAAELYLLEQGTAGPPPREAVPLRYAAPGVGMIRGTSPPRYDAGRACDELNT